MEKRRVYPVVNERTIAATRNRSGVKSVSAVVLAAGEATRYGAAKVTATIAGKPLLMRVLESVKRAGIGDVVVVVGCRAEEVRRSVGGLRARVVVNPGYKSGLSSSLKLGLSEVEGDSSAILVLLADQPLVPTSHIRKVLSAFLESGRDVIASTAGEEVAPPMLFGRRIFPELERLDGDKGAKSVALTHDDLVRVPASDPTLLMDVDTRRDLRVARRLFSRTKRSRAARGPRLARR